MLAFTLKACMVLVGGELLSFVRTSATDRHFYDEAGRVRIFRGGNRVRKSPPWYFEDELASDREAQVMEDLGLNFVRLGFMWTGFNPQPGVFNFTYARIMTDIIDRFSKHGIYTLIDLHQDGLSSRFCNYDGAPEWVSN